MAFTFCTSGAAIRKAGANANTTITASGAALSAWSNEAESAICNQARVDLVTKYADLKANGKEILQAISSAMIAQKIVAYDMSGYSQRREAETMLDVLENEIRRNLNLIEEDKIKTYLNAT